MIDRRTYQDGAYDSHDYHPGVEWRALRIGLLEMSHKHAGEPDQATVGKHLCKIIERPLPADISRLGLFVESRQIDTVGGDVMRGARKSYHTHDRYHIAEKVGQRKQKRNQGETEP